MEPISTDYRGYTVYELPPNGQGMAALQMLNILEGYDIAGLGHNSPDYLHLLIEAKKAAFSDRDAFITDPEFESSRSTDCFPRSMRGPSGSGSTCGQAKSPPAPSSRSAPSDTVYVTAVDGERNAVSFISSIFHHFGSGVAVDGTGIILQNRGSSFSLDPGHFNRLEPHKRTMHTIVPAMLFKDEQFLMSFGVVGADMQPQGQVQFLANVIDFRMNLQEAMDCPTGAPRQRDGGLSRGGDPRRGRGRSSAPGGINSLRPHRQSTRSGEGRRSTWTAHTTPCWAHQTVEKTGAR